MVCVFLVSTIWVWLSCAKLVANVSFSVGKFVQKEGGSTFGLNYNEKKSEEDVLSVLIPVE